MVIAVIGVISVLSLVPIGSTIEETRFQDTLSEMQAIRGAMLGDPTVKENGARTSYGYLGDLGALPTSGQGISALSANPGHPTWALDSTVRFGRGWNGPYLSSGQPGTDFTKDSWGNAYIYNPTASPPTLVSRGADNAAGGTGFNSDITVELPVNLQRATVHGFISTGGAPYTGTATVTINYPNGSGALATSTASLTATDKGYFSFANIPLGKRSVTVVVGTTTIGPTIINVDSANYMIPSEFFNMAASGGGTGGGGGGSPTPTATPSGCTSAGAITYNTNNGLTGGNKVLRLRLNVNSAVSISQVKVSTSNSSTWTVFAASDDAKTASCSGGTVSLNPCTVNSGSFGVFSAGMTVNPGTAKQFQVTFSSNMNNAYPATIEITHSGGCDVITVPTW